MTNGFVKFALLWAIFVVCLSIFAEAKPKSSALNFFGGRPYDGFRQVHKRIPGDERAKVLAQAAANAYEFTYTQTLDHFTQSDTRTWAQRYFYNGDMYVEGGPQFIILGGEGSERVEDVLYPNYPHVQWAKQLNGMVFALEHRFYGKSRPFPTQTTENLVYLTSKQALADIAQFITSMNTQMNIKNPKWIVIGGSYSGALTLWFRQQYPNLCIGAVGSSAPVEPVLDFYRYLEVCQNSIYNNGSFACGEAIKDGVRNMVSGSYDAYSRNVMSDLFKLVPYFSVTPLDYKTFQTFFSSIIGNFMGAVQYSRVNAGPYKTGSSIADVCSIMTNNVANKGQSNLERLASVNQYISIQSNGGYDGLDYSYNEMVSELKNVSYSDLDLDFSSSRSWVWQTCNEFAYFQSTGSGNSSIWGASIPNNYYIDLCTDVFGVSINADYIKKAVAATRAAYGGTMGYSATNVVMPNGDLDPWHALGSYNSTDYTMVPYLIHNSAHCADMEPPGPNDVPGVVYVRNLIFMNIQQWLGLVEFDTASQATSINMAMESKAVAEPKYEERSVEESPLKFHKELLREPVNTFKHIQPGMVHGLPAPKLLEHQVFSANNVIRGSINQKLDHFNNTDISTFKQKYFWNNQFSTNSGYVFLFLGGEGVLDPKWLAVETLPMLQWAKEVGADVYGLEHRFYGDSIPDMYNSKLQFHTSKQALADIAVFIKSINKNKGYTTAKWVTFGGGYSGSLSAWSRQSYPNLVTAAVASSPFLQAKVDFFEYLQQVQASIAVKSYACGSNIHRAFTKLQQLMIDTTKRNQVNTYFNLTTPWVLGEEVVDTDAQTLFSNIYATFQLAVQYNNDNQGKYASGYGISNVCSFMNNDNQDPIANLRDVVNYNNGATVVKTSNRFQESVGAYAAGLAAGASQGARDAVLWFYQTCNEFGYFQSSDSGANIFDSAASVNIFINQCQGVFGSQYTRDLIEANVYRTNLYYGGNTKFNGTNIVMSFGSLDPWTRLGMTPAQSTNNLNIFQIDGGAHASDMYSPRASDSADLVAKRTLIQQALYTLIQFNH
uniref:Serine protease K12H4.7 n=1 Tax=Rhabditophanes sp. KR3021 TaxID=114890 RepID=A0AC35U7I1_9BILA